jgi:hypothetical protein
MDSYREHKARSVNLLTILNYQGVTTVVTGVLKQSLKEDVHGISIAEGKGSKSTATKNDISAKLIIYYIQYNNNDRNVQSRNCQISYARYIHRKTCYS